jgi:hypothetical protein
MFVGSEQHIVSLTSRELSIAAVRGGRVVRTERLTLDERTVEAAWANGLHELDQPLRQVMNRMGMQSIGGATLLYMSPSVVTRVELSTLEPGAAGVKLGADIARNIGRTSPSATHVLSSHKDGDEQRTLVMGIGDSDEHLRMLFAWLSRCKVSVKRMVPRQAVALVKAHRLMESAPADSAVVYFAEYASVIGYREHGRDALMRVTELGSGKIVDVFALYGTGRGSGDEDAPRDRISTDRARRIAYEVGIPIGADRARGVDPELMPALVPILQRFCVEIKQTFRFATNVERGPSELMLAGPACTIPSLGAALAQSLEYHITRDPDAATHSPCEPFGVGSLEHDAIGVLDSVPGLLPRIAEEQRTTRSLMRAVRVGALVAALALGTEFALDYTESSTIRAELEKQQATIDMIERERMERLETARIAGSVSAAARLIRAGMGAEADWGATLAGIPVSQRDSVRIHEVQGRFSGHRPVLTISGHAVSSEAHPDPSKLLSEYIGTLRAIEGVERIEIASTSRVKMDDRSDGVRFSLTVELVASDRRVSSIATIDADAALGGL